MRSRDEDKKHAGLPEQPAPYEVGYGKPPEATRFKPGKSGNPKGRPKGSRNRKPGDAVIGRLKDVILEEAYRPIQVREGGELMEIPAVQAALRSLGVQAAKGKQGAQSLLLALTTEVETERAKQRIEVFEAFVEYKVNCERHIAEARRRGLEPPEFLPDPANLIIDPVRGTVTSTGPWTKEEKAEYDKVQDLKAYIEGRLAAAERKLRRRPGDAQVEQQIASMKRVLGRIDESLDYEMVIVAALETE